MLFTSDDLTSHLVVSLNRVQPGQVPNCCYRQRGGSLRSSVLKLTIYLLSIRGTGDDVEDTSSGPGNQLYSSGPRVKLTDTPGIIRFCITAFHRQFAF